MAELKDRRRYEEGLARALGRANGRIRAKVAKAFGDKPDMNALAELWLEITEEFDAALYPRLREIFVAAFEAEVEALLASNAVTNLGLELGADLIQDTAARWAREYTYELVNGINDTSKSLLQDAVSKFYDGDATLDDVRDMIAKVFGPERAEMIAVTEVTRAHSGGSREYQKQLADQGITTLEVWQTARDDLVCPICGPRHDTVLGATDGAPPAHPRCRCWTIYLVQ